MPAVMFLTKFEAILPEDVEEGAVLRQILDLDLTQYFTKNTYDSDYNTKYCFKDVNFLPRLLSRPAARVVTKSSKCDSHTRSECTPPGCMIVDIFMQLFRLSSAENRELGHWIGSVS